MAFTRRYALRLLSLLPYGWAATLFGRVGLLRPSELAGRGKLPDRLPQEQTDDLDRQLRDHQARLHQLRRKMTTLQEEAAVHEVVIKLGRDPSVLSAFGSLYTHPELAAKMAQSPAIFARERGIEIPEGVKVIVADSQTESVKVEAHFAMGLHKLRITWDRNQGFFLEPTERS